MQKNLVIVESPAKAKTIEKFLGKDYKVMSSYGHIRDLKTKEFSIDIEHDYAPQYVIPADKKKLVSELKSEAKSAEQVWLASDEDRETMIRQAVNDGAEVIVCVGYLYGASLAWAADQYPDVKFIAVDVTQGDIGTDAIPANCYCITFKEEQAGYLAGYAIVKDGKTKLGFLGGMAVPAVIRYGYGYVQGADAAAQELGTNIDINYFYGGQFYGDANITSRMEGWYSNGTQVVFACGGGIYTSAVEAALKNNGYVIGVDVDQNYIGVNGVADGSFAYNPFITSAMKGLTEAVNTALSDIEAGDWSDIAASNGNFGLEDGDYIGLPTDADSWNFETFTTDEYEEVKGKIKSGEITVDNSSDDATKPTVSEFTTVNYIQ